MTRAVHPSIGGADLAEKGPGRPRRHFPGIGHILREALGEEQVADDLAERRLYDHDIAPPLSLLELMFRTIPDAVVRPRDARAVSLVMKLANEHGFPVIPRGAATWGLGGAVPTRGGVVLDMSALDRVLDIDTGRRTVTVEAGAVWGRVIEAARRKGLHIGTYPSSFPAATVGGWIGVGGVGIGTCRYGRIGASIASLEAVLPDGSIIDTADDFQKFVGTEGIFGIVTKVVLKARPLPDRIVPFSYSFPGLGEACPFVGLLDRGDVAPEHVMFADRANFEMLRWAGIETGVESALVTVVLAGESAAVEKGGRLLDELAKGSGGRRAPDSIADREWRQRSYEFRMRRAGTGSLPGEVLVPLARWREAMDGTYRLISGHRLNAAVIGTLADRGEFMLMPYYLLDERRQTRALAAMSFNYRLAELALRLGGRPVGQGIYFAFLRDRLYDREEVQRLLDMKRRLDPNGVLNPGKMLEARTRFGTMVPPSASVLMMKLYGMLRSRMAPERMPRRYAPLQDTEAEAPGRD